MGSQDLFKPQLVRNLNDYTQGLGLTRHDADHDFLATHNMDLLLRGIDPRTKQIFNHYLCHKYAEHGDPIAKQYWNAYIYNQNQAKLRKRVNADVNISYNRMMAEVNKRFAKYGRPKGV